MPAGAAAPFFWGAVVGTAGAVGSAAIGSRSADRSARAQTQAANQAANLEAQSARDALAFEREREAARQREFREVQDRNYALYREADARLQPYRQLGRGALGQMMRPLPRPHDPGSLGSMMGGQ